MDLFRHPPADSQASSGLGLSIVKRYGDLLGGSISAVSRVHVGTKWRVRLPINRLEHGLQEKPKPERQLSLAGRRILLCEDNLMNAEIATMLLKDAGIIVETAENGMVGLEKFTAASPHYYDLVLMDIRMPEMDGYEATKAIRALPRPDAKSTPIIAMTADAFEESLRAAKEAGMDAYLTKPIEPRKLFEELQKQIGHD